MNSMTMIGSPVALSWTPMWLLPVVQEDSDWHGV